MTFQVNHLSIQQLSVHQDQLVQRGNYRDLADADISPVIIEEMHSTFIKKPNRCFAHFSSSSAEHGFESMLTEWLINKTEFVAFSEQACHRLLRCMNASKKNQDGFLLIADYEFLASRYLMLAILTTKPHIQIKEDFTLLNQHHLDVKQMPIAVQINLSKYQHESIDAPIAYLQGRMGRTINDFFAEFIGCEDQADTHSSGIQFTQVVEEYMTQTPVASADLTDVRASVGQYLKQQVAEGEPVVLKQIDELLPKQSEQGFHEFNQSLEKPLNEQVVVDGKAIKSFAKYSGQGKGISLSFDKSLLGDQIHFDPETNTLTMQQLPPNLVDQLTKAVSQIDEL